MSEDRDVAAGVLDELRRGVRTTAEIMQATGLTRNAVNCAVRRAQAEGYRILNVRSVGGHREGLYYLAYDVRNPQRRRCAWHGCDTHLSPSNSTIYCRRHLAQAAYFVYLERLCEVLDELMGAESDEQLDIFQAAAV